jgi:hypothetical protein
MSLKSSLDPYVLAAILSNSGFSGYCSLSSSVAERVRRNCYFDTYGLAYTPTRTKISSGERICALYLIRLKDLDILNRSQLTQIEARCLVAELYSVSMFPMLYAGR